MWIDRSVPADQNYLLCKYWLIKSSSRDWVIDWLTGCFSIFSKKIKASNSSLESVYNKICSNIYNQLLMIEGIRKIKRIDADLMMEQSVVCGLLGYYEFLSPTRMENLIKWQRESGCYGDIEEEENSKGNHSKQTMRKILMEKELSGKLFFFFWVVPISTYNPGQKVLGHSLFFTCFVWNLQLTGNIATASERASRAAKLLAFAAPFACCSRVISRDSPK